MRDGSIYSSGNVCDEEMEKYSIVSVRDRPPCEGWNYIKFFLLCVIWRSKVLYCQCEGQSAFCGIECYIVLSMCAISRWKV